MIKPFIDLLGLTMLYVNDFMTKQIKFYKADDSSSKNGFTVN